MHFQVKRKRLQGAKMREKTPGTMIAMFRLLYNEISKALTLKKNNCALPNVES